MQKLTVILFTLLLSLPFSVQSRDLEADEVELRESPQQMYDVLNKSISFPLRSKTVTNLSVQPKSKATAQSNLNRFCIC